MRAFDLILSQGRIADRTPGAIHGAELTAAALAPRLGGERRQAGAPESARADDWRQSLPAAGETLAGLREALEETLSAGRVPLMVANTCSASLASLPLVARHHPDAVVLWVDAHGDFNTPATTGSGYLGGMVLAAACGLWQSGHGAGLDPRQVVIVGGRDIDPAEAELLRAAGVRVIAPAEATPQAVLAAVGTAPVWIHIDWDALEPGFVPAAYKVPGGLMPGQLRDVLAAFDGHPVAGIELAEFEASGEATVDGQAVAVIADIVSPLLPAA